MAKYQIEIVETLSRLEEVEAETLQDALDQTYKQYTDGDIILTADNANSDFEINAI